MDVLETIVEDLKALPQAKLKEAAEYIHRMAVLTREERVAILSETSGTWTPEDADAVERAINEGCEKIDAHEW